MKTLFLVIALVVSVQAQKDWTEHLPEIPGCVMTVTPKVRVGEVVEQTVEYKAGDQPCGSIVLRYESGLLNRKRTEFAGLLSDPFGSWIKVKGFDTLQNSPWCGNDPFLGAQEVFFEKNKSLTVAAYVWGSSILQFAQTADYRSLGKVIGKKGFRRY